MNRYNSRTIKIYVCILVCILNSLIIRFLCNKAQEGAKTELKNVSLDSTDDAIIIKWDSPSWNICDYVTIQIKDETNIVYERNIWPIIEKISYKNGEHGKIYIVSVSAHYRDGSTGDSFEKETLFLDYDQLPDLPLIIINTYSGTDPTYDEAEKPDDSLWGGTIVNNKYLSGKMTMSGGGLKTISTGVNIKVRGNASSIIQDKKSYKINLYDTYDLLGKGNSYSCKKWVLLNNGRDLKTYIGDYVGALCGMEWQPQMMFVNLILNGDWKGCYCLTEAVCIESSYGLVSETGYIFENDAYWWNSEDLYFKTDNQIYQLGYTFKYPDIRSKDKTAVLALQNYMQEFEDRILSGDISYQDYIDEQSYISWILARDIMGNADGGGSNMYFYKYDFDESNPTASKVKMGPLWDFDGAFSIVDNWSECRAGDVSYFPQLFNQDSFANKYTETWGKISPYLYDNIKKHLDDLDESIGKENIEASWQLDGRRWNVEVESFYNQKEKVLEWFSKRIIWMDQSLHINFR